MGIWINGSLIVTFSGDIFSRQFEQNLQQWIPRKELISLKVFDCRSQILTTILDNQVLQKYQDNCPFELAQTLRVVEARM